MDISEASFGGINEEYRPIPSANLVLCSFGSFLLLVGRSTLTGTAVFRYSCFYLHVCSLWMSFGVFVTGVLFHTATFVSFLLIALGYCITCERLSCAERRTTAALGCIFYLILVGYQASVPYFSVLLLLNYLISFYVIFHHISRNLFDLREQLSIIEDEDVHTMHDAVVTKYTMFKKFQGAMHILAMAEFAIFISLDSSLENTWLRLVVREWAHFCIFVYIGWTFRSKDLAPRFLVMPTLKCRGQKVVPPIYSIEMDAATFKEFRSHEWHIGVPTSVQKGRLKDSVLVVIQHPHVDVQTSANSTLLRTAAVSTSNLAISSDSLYENHDRNR